MSKKNQIPETTGYPWKFKSVGGCARVDITSGEDIASLGELDQKLWTVLSCPSKGLEFDPKTLAILDTDADGKIRVDEVVAAAKWITSVLKDKDLLLKGSDTLPLAEIDESNENGAALKKSAGQILSNLGLEKDSISLADTSDSVAIFAKTKFNGDGIITPASTDDEKLAATITTIVAALGGKADRSGVDGTDAETIEKFYAELADYVAWQDAFEAGKADILPYGDSTAAALDACNALKDKIADYFMRCKLVSFNEGCAGAVDVSAEKIGAISDKNLAACADEIATYPLARPSKDGILRFEGINPAWQAAFASLKGLVLDIDFPGAEGIDEAQWNATLAKFGAFSAWTGAKKGAAVESLGLDAVKTLLAENSKDALLALVGEDLALKAEAEGIDAVDKMMHLYRYFYDFLRNYVSMGDLYDKDSKAVFEAGRLYIDQRCCELCIEVADMGKHADMAGLSGMFLIYCTCTSKVKGATKNIVAVMTDGGIKNLRPGTNAIFYDRQGLDWDAVVTKIVDNPISIKQAFWSPYRKFANTITDRINKNAAEKENKVNADMTAKANNVNVPTTEEEKKAAAAAAPKPSFDIAKFAGIFAAIGMAVAYLTTALAALVKPWYNVLIVLLVLILCISGPSMFLAWQKLRKRNLGPVLNANGWAINSVILVNIVFGGTLTSIAKFPRLDMIDPEAKAKMKRQRRKVVCWIIGLVVVAFGALYLCNCLKGFGLKSPLAKEEPAAVEQVEAAPEAEAPETSEAEAPAAETPAE